MDRARRGIERRRRRQRFGAQYARRHGSRAGGKRAPRNTAHGIGRTGGGIGRTAGGIGRTGGGISGTGGGITRTTGDGDDGACIGTGGRGSRTAITSHDERRRDRKSRPWVDRNPHQ